MTTKELGKCEALLNGTACSALYRAALDAEDNWKAELSMVFGPRAASVCYTKVSEGEDGSLLRKLYLAMRIANDTWFQCHDRDLSGKV